MAYMRVLQLTNSFRPFFNDQVDTLRNHGVEVETVCVPGERIATDETVQPRSTLDYVRFYPRVVKNSMENFDIIHANHGLTAPFAIAQPDRPIVLTLWGSDLVSTLGPLSKYSSHFFDEVILPAKNMSSYLPRSSSIIPYGININRFQPMSRDDARDYVGWNRNESVILFPYPKSREVKNYQLAKQIVQKMDAEVSLHTLSDIPHSEVPYYMNASNAVLVTSKRETGPMVVKEAAVCNVPVVSTNVGFVSQSLDDISTSYVCKSVSEFVEKLDYIVRTGERSDGSKKAKDWSINNMGEELTNLYKNII